MKLLAIVAVLPLSLWPNTAFPEAAAPPSLRIEDLGPPMIQRRLGIRCVTRDSAGMLEAWGAFETADRFALVGVRIDNGRTTWVDINQFGPPPGRARHPQMTVAADGNLYAFVGVPGRFIKYDVTRRKLTDLGIPAPKASYWLGSAVGPDGRFYLGTSPETELLRCDPASGKVENLGRLTNDKRDTYAPHPVVSDDNVVYCPVGLHHGELWAVDARSGVRRQILPDSLLDKQGAPEVWRGKDGRVYGRWAGVQFRCTPDAIVSGETSPPTPHSAPKLAGDLSVGDIDSEGKLKLTRQGKVSYVATDYPGASRSIYSVGCERNGRVYGGGVSPAHTFAYDPTAKRFTDFGQLASGPIQVYDTLNHPRGLFIASYMNASVDLFDPDGPLKDGENPRRVVTLAGQERPLQIILGPDDRLYSGTTPAKGRLGGALLRVNPTDLTHKVWTNIIANQSIGRLVCLPNTGLVLGATSIYGGSSATPTESEACIFLWDCQREEVVFTARPLPGTKTYGALVRAANGVVYGVDSRSNKFYAFDPTTRKTLFTGALPIKTLHFPELADEPSGPRGLIYGLGDDALFAIDPANHTAKVLGRDPALKNSWGFCLTHDGRLYFGARGHLLRCLLPE